MSDETKPASFKDLLVWQKGITLDALTLLVDLRKMLSALRRTLVTRH
jgi:hypothetical protein